MPAPTSLDRDRFVPREVAIKQAAACILEADRALQRAQLEASRHDVAKAATR